MLNVLFPLANIAGRKADKEVDVAMPRFLFMFIFKVFEAEFHSFFVCLF